MKPEELSRFWPGKRLFCVKDHDITRAKSQAITITEDGVCIVVEGGEAYLPDQVFESYDKLEEWLEAKLERDKEVMRRPIDCRVRPEMPVEDNIVVPVKLNMLRKLSLTAFFECLFNEFLIDKILKLHESEEDIT